MKKEKSAVLPVKRKSQKAKKEKAAAVQAKPSGLLSFRWFTKLIGK